MSKCHYIFYATVAQCCTLLLLSISYMKYIISLNTKEKQKESKKEKQKSIKQL